MSPYHPQYPYPIYIYPVAPSVSGPKPQIPSPLLDNNVISTNNPYSSNKSPNPENLRSSDSSISSNLTPGDKETLQSDSFHSEEKPVLLKSNVAEQSSAQNVVNMNMKSTSGGSPPRSLMTPSLSGQTRNGGIPQHQNQRKVSTSSSVPPSPKRARSMNVNNNAAAHAGATGKASTTAPSTQPTHFKNKTWISPTVTTTVPTSQATPSSPTSVTSNLSASVMDICNQKPSKPNHRGGGLQHQQRPPRTFYGANHWNATAGAEGQTLPTNAHGGQRGRYQHGYSRGGYHRHGGGGQYSQMSTADVNRRQRPHQP